MRAHTVDGEEDPVWRQTGCFGHPRQERVDRLLASAIRTGSALDPVFLDKCEVVRWAAKWRGVATSARS